MIPGEYFIKPGEIELNKGRKTLTLTVSNSGDRPIQVGSHYHFFETNPALQVRPRQSARHAPRHRGGNGGALRARPEPRGDAGRGCGRAHRLRFPPGGHGKAEEMTRRRNATVKNHDGRACARPSRSQRCYPLLGTRIKSTTWCAADSRLAPRPTRPWRSSHPAEPNASDLTLRITQRSRVAS